MTRKEAERQTRQLDMLRSLGFTRDEAESLRRISMTLRRWYELECGTEHGCIERNETTGKPYWHDVNTNWRIPYGRNYSIPDRETGAKKRLHKIIGARNARCVNDPKSSSVSAYIQTDPRGAALYILRPGDVPEGEDPGAFYNRGICVY